MTGTAALALMIGRPSHRATLRELCEAERIDVSDGPPFLAGHPIFKLAHNLIAFGSVQCGPARGLDTEFYISNIKTAAKGTRYT